VVEVLGQQDLGHRVVVRHLVGQRHGRPLYTDVLGELTAITDTALTVATHTGPTTVTRASVVAAKRIPPRPVTRRAVAALERAANDAWPAPVQEPLGEWLLRAADGWSWRANSALPLGEAGMPLEAAVDQVERWYAARGLPARISVPLPLATRVDRALDARGWDRRDPVLVQTAPLAVVRPAAADPPAGGRTVLADQPDEAWLALAGTARQTGPGPLPEAARYVLTAGGVWPVRFAYLYDDTGALVGAGRGTVTGAGRWLGLSRVTVVPSARGRGLARRVVAALASWADEVGATDAYLQVEEGNAAAVALYARLGFATHHTYVARGSSGD
jgi:N-acetylglutamate synthase